MRSAYKSNLTLKINNYINLTARLKYNVTNQTRILIELTLTT